MTAVQAPISALHDTFKSLDISSRHGYGGQQGGSGSNITIADKIKKTLVSEEEKNRRLFKTSYEPSVEWWTSNNAAYNAPAHDPLPEGFPESVSNSSVWDGRSLINEPEKWIYHFSPADIEHLETAHEHFLSQNKHFDEISRVTFPISTETTLYKALTATREAISTGLGFRVLRGLPVDKWDRLKQIAVFAGLSAYVGEARVKQGEQNIVHLRDITNLDVDKRPAITVKGQTSGNQVFHNDGATDIVGLITLGVAETGGLSQLSSVGQTYNHLATKRRDILREIAKSDWKNKIFPEGVPLFFTLPADGSHSSLKVISQYSRRPYFGFYEAESDVQPLSAEKHLALDAVHFTAEQFSLDLALEKGDLEYFNNHSVFHARTSSTDSEVNQRHLIRVHLRADADFQELHRPSSVGADWDRLNSGSAHEWPEEAWSSVDGYMGMKDVKVTP